MRKAVEIARAAPGIAEVRAFTKEESAQLVEPWLGAGLALDDLPIPRLIVVKLASGARRISQPLRQALAAQGPDRQPRRSSPLDRSHAHHGGNGGRRRRRGTWPWCWR